MVLLLGWRNGVLIGTTAGATIGVTLGIIANNEPIVVASYAISGMIAGILNRFGKICNRKWNFNICCKRRHKQLRNV